MKSAIQSLLTAVLLTGLILSPLQGQNPPPATENPPAQAAPVPATDPEPPAAPNPAVTLKVSKKSKRSIKRGAFPVQIQNDNDGNRVAVGSSAEVKAGDSVRDFVVVLGDGTVDGTVDGNMVVVMGDAHVNGKVHGNAVNVGGGLYLGPNAVVEGDAVGVLGGVFMEDGAKVVGQVVPVPMPGFSHFNSELITRTFSECIVLARPLSLHVGWVWWVWLGFIGIYVLLTLLFPKAVEATADVYAERTASSFLMGILSLPLILIITALLVATVVGALVVPFFLAAVLAGEIIGKAALLYQLGRLVGRSTQKSFATLVCVLIGAVLMSVLYLVPFFGLLLNIVTNFWALGAATLAFTARFRRESPKPLSDGGRPPMTPTPKPGPTPTHPPTPSAGTTSASGVSAIVAAPALLAVTTVEPSLTQSQPSSSAEDFGLPSSTSTAGPGAVPTPAQPFGQAAPEPPQQAPPHIPPFSPPPVAAIPEALTLPRAGFGRRFVASALDWILVIFLLCMPPLRHLHYGPGFIFFLLAAAYFVGFYIWKNTTLGGLVLGLKVVRLDGRRIDFPCAIVRTLGTFFSVLIGGIGWFWCIWDKERQAWHDKLAGTVIVRVEKMPPLV